MKQEERLLKKGREEQEERLLKRGRGDGIVQDFNKTCTFFCICRKNVVPLHPQSTTGSPTDKRSLRRKFI